MHQNAADHAAHADHDDHAPPPGAGVGTVTTADPLGLVRALEASGRFRRDTPLGGMFHRGKISYREISRTDSLHVIIDSNRVSAHVDTRSPLNCDPESPTQYSWLGVFVHNVAGLCGDIARRLGGRQGEQRCNLECEVVWVDDDPASDLVAENGEVSTNALLHLCQLDHVDEVEEGEGAPPGARTVDFSVIDEAIHLFDTEAAPWSVQMEARVGGPLDPDRLRTALRRALEAHPMARARKVPSRRTVHRDRWEIPDTPDLDVLDVVECPDDTALAAARADLQRRAVPLVESPPLRARLARHPSGDVLMLNVNHAAMDGFGAMRVLQSVAHAYTGTPDPAPTLDFLDARELPRRLAGASVPTRVRRVLALAEKTRDLVGPPARLAPEGATDEPGYGFHHVALSTEETAALVDLDHPGAVNDVLLAALHRAIASWNAEHGSRCGRIGVLVPANLRPREWREDMVGNFTLPARVSTTRHDRRDARLTLEAVTGQTRRKKEWGMGTATIEPLSHSHLLPLWAKQALVAMLPLTGDRLIDTAMLSNMGRVTDPPSFTQEAGDPAEVWFSPPARMPLGLSIGAITVCDRLHLAFRYRHRLFGPGAALRFADGFLHELDGLVNAGR